MPNVRCFNCKKRWLDSGAIPPDCYYCGKCPEGVTEVPTKEEIDTWSEIDSESD